MIELVPMERTNENSEFALRLKRDAIGPLVIPKWGWDDAHQRTLHAERWQSKTFFRIAQDGVAVGVIAIDEAPDHVHLAEFYISPAAQRMGVGTAVLGSVLANASAKHLPVRLRCLKWNPALSLYRRHDFVVTSESDIHFYMEKSAGTNDR